MFPHERMECQQPGGIQPQRPGGSIQTPAAVSRIAKPDWREKSCPFECECSSVLQKISDAGRQKSTWSLDRSTVSRRLLLSLAILAYSLATLAQCRLCCLLMMSHDWRWGFRLTGGTSALPIPSPRIALRISWTLRKQSWEHSIQRVRHSRVLGPWLEQRSDVTKKETLMNTVLQNIPATEGVRKVEP